MIDCLHPGHPLVLVVEVESRKATADPNVTVIHGVGEARLVQCEHCGRIGVSAHNGIRWAK